MAHRVVVHGTERRVEPGAVRRTLLLDRFTQHLDGAGAEVVRRLQQENGRPGIPDGRKQAFAQDRHAPRDRRRREGYIAPNAGELLGGDQRLNASVRYAGDYDPVLIDEW